MEKFVTPHLCGLNVREGDSSIIDRMVITRPHGTKAREGSEYFREGDSIIPEIRYKIIYGIDHYKSMPETFVEQNHTYQKTDSIHQFPSCDELYAVYMLKK